MQQARAAGFTTSIDIVSEDSDRFAAVVRPALPHTDHAILNEFEAERTTGLRIRTSQGIDVPQLRAAANRLLETGVRAWVVIHFPEGAIAARPDGTVLFQGSVRLAQDSIRGTTGAGDAFSAGLLYGLHEGKLMEECLHYAVCVAAACLTEANCSDGIRPVAQCLELGKTHGFRPVMI